MAFSGCVDSLVNSCMYSIVKNLPMYSDKIASVPINIKDRLLHVMSKRGLLCDSNISSCLYSSLKEIDLSACDVSNSTLDVLSVATLQLDKIDLNSAKGNRDSITSVGVIALSKGCQNLQTVYLRRCIQLTDEAVIALAENCLFLKQLNIGGCFRITDSSLKALGRNSANLSSLNVSRTAITDDGIYSLSSGLPGPSLTELHINQCNNLTDRAAITVTEFCPSIKILLLHGCPKMTDAVRIAMDGVATKMKQVTWTIY